MSGQLEFELLGTRTLQTGWTQLRFVGFGAATANTDIVCGPEDPNPDALSAYAQWQDFRFYGDWPGVGIIRGALNRSRYSGVDLTANTGDGLFPAEMLNNLFITISIPWGEGDVLQYENETVLATRAESIPQAPPGPGVVSHQLHAEDVLELMTPTPGAPVRAIITDAVQTFPELGGISLERVSSAPGQWRFRVLNSFPQDVTVAWFCHVTDVDPLVQEQLDLDGVMDVNAGGAAQFDIDLQPIPLAGDSVSYIYAILLKPHELEGTDWVVITGMPEDIPTVSEWGLVVLALLLLVGGTIYSGRRAYAR